MIQKLDDVVINCLNFLQDKLSSPKYYNIYVEQYKMSFYQTMMFAIVNNIPVTEQYEWMIKQEWYQSITPP